MACISTKSEDGGHFVPFDQNICRSKQDIKNGKILLYTVLKVLSKEIIKKIYCHFPLMTITQGVVVQFTQARGP